MPVVGGMVWIQCGLGAECGHLGDVGVHCDALRRGRGGDWVERGGVAAEWAVYGAGCDLRSSGRAGSDYPGFRLCDTHVGVVDRPDRRGMLLPDGGEGQGSLWL